MVLKIPSGLFGQEDVRETPAGTVTSQTRYLAINPSLFSSKNPDIDNVDRQEHYFHASGNSVALYAHIQLPHGAVVTGCIVYGNAGATAETWALFKCDHAEGAPVSMASANIGTGDTSITDATIDNQNYTYCIETSTIDAADRVYGGVITYTTDVIEV